MIRKSSARPTGMVVRRGCSAERLPCRRLPDDHPGDVGDQGHHEEQALPARHPVIGQEEHEQEGGHHHGPVDASASHPRRWGTPPQALSTRLMFAMLEPTTLPMAISGPSFQRVATRLTSSSGSEVPRETTVRPTTRERSAPGRPGGPPRSRSSAPRMSTAAPPRV